MLNGIDPILIFNFKLVTEDALAVASSIPIFKDATTVDLPPIPIYLSGTLTGLYIDSEDKNIEIETSVETLTSGEDPEVVQKAINSTVRIQMIASKESIGMTLLSAVMDLIVPKVTSQEYSITYLNGAVTVFGGLLHSFSINQNSQDDRYNITLELTKTKANKTKEKPKITEVEPVPENITLDGGVTAPTETLKTTPAQGPTSGAVSVPLG